MSDKYQLVVEEQYGHIAFYIANNPGLEITVELLDENRNLVKTLEIGPEMVCIPKSDLANWDSFVIKRNKASNYNFIPI